MKDMSVEELLQKLYDGYESKIHAEILRRFEAMKCCGNCKHYVKYECPNCKIYNGWPRSTAYCDSWQSDGLTREEREGE